MSELLQSADFQSQLDQIFSIHFDDATVIDLQLVSVKELGATTGSGTRAPFSLQFLGPVSQQYLRQHTYQLVNEKLLNSCHQQKIKVIPWTVNDKAKIAELKLLGVDGVITDYPDLFNE